MTNDTTKRGNAGQPSFIGEQAYALIAAAPGAFSACLMLRLVPDKIGMIFAGAMAIATLLVIGSQLWKGTKRGALQGRLGVTVGLMVAFMAIGGVIGNEMGRRLAEPIGRYLAMEQISGAATAINGHVIQIDEFRYAIANTVPSRACVTNDRSQWPCRDGDRDTLARAVEQGVTECRVLPNPEESPPLAIRRAHCATDGRDLTRVINARRETP